MFDFGFSQLIVIALVLLVVVGPERLPRVARTAGHLFGRMQRYISDVKADIQREMQLDELKNIQEQARTFEQSLRKEIGKVRSDVQEALSPPEPDAGGTTTAALPQVVAAAPTGQVSAQEPQSAPGLEPAPVPAPAVPTKPADSV
ncbi:MAG: Sec-independent protein translocase protein TatB [Betaproteobacteria bacterium]|nr:Sec-independent protein translocase protein TatB [Betaproteobacteria bacterium]